MPAGGPGTAIGRRQIGAAGALIDGDVFRADGSVGVPLVLALAVSGDPNDPLGVPAALENALRTVLALVALEASPGRLRVETSDRDGIRVTGWSIRVVAADETWESRMGEGRETHRNDASKKSIEGTVGQKCGRPCRIRKKICTVRGLPVCHVRPRSMLSRINRRC